MKKHHYIILFFLCVCSVGFSQVDGSKRTVGTSTQTTPVSEVKQTPEQNFAKEKFSKAPPASQPVNKEKQTAEELVNPAINKKKPE
jgi:hypothetical protein